MSKMKNPYHMPMKFHIAILVLQLISTFERQIFDFLGFMWLPIVGNFFNIIFVIFGLFGIYQQRAVCYLFTYATWMLVWISYNSFIICFYLEAGDLNRTEDVLSFGAGSFSWWLENSPGCKPVYNISVPELNPVGPPRPSSVEGCYVRFEKIEVTHAAIQLVLAVLGFIMSIVMIRCQSSVKTPQMEKQGVKAMYSIEYSPQRHESNQNTLEQETDLQLENGEARAHMTPRRVKRRSYRSSNRNTKSMPRQSNRQSGRSARSSGRSHKSINPVTRLIDADQNQMAADSSTSNDNTYGQINPGFQSEVSRPNSIYNLSGPPTDAESGIRPHSVLTSYSNFHGQRQQPAVGGQATAFRGAGATANAVAAVPQKNVTNLTQESLMNHDKQHSLDASYDDLPPPPPPLNSQGADNSDDSDNTSSVATAQMPVPTIRGSTRRNEYVNIPLPKENILQTKQKPEPQSESSRPPPALNDGQITPSAGSDISQHNYANMMQQDPDKSLYGEMDKSSGSVLTYEAETLRATNSLINQGLYNDPYSIKGVSQQNTQWNSNQQNMYNGFQEPEYGMVLGSQPNNSKPKPPERSSSQTPIRNVRNGVSQPNANGVNNQTTAYNTANNSQQPEPQYTTNQNPHAQGNSKPIPRGHAARDRASLRLKQRKEMESKSHLPPPNPHQPKQSSEVNGEPSYYSYQQQQQQPQHHNSKYINGSGPTSLQNHTTSRPPAMLPPHHLQNGGGINHNQPTSLPPTAGNSADNGEPEDRWFMKDSMRPVGAANHGASCKCYRCQRKLTAI